MVGHVLAHAGLKVLMLEVGPLFDPRTDARQLKFFYESPRRGAFTPGPLATSTPPMVAGSWRASPTPPKTRPSLIGFGRAC
jgi:hypothetical protein